MLNAGRIFALVLSGILLGAGLFLSRHLRPESVEREVRAALETVLAGPFRLEEVLLDLERGVELQGLALLYPDGEPALEVERVQVTLDARQLLSGEVEVRQVDLYGLQVHLRPAPGAEVPSMPGVFAAPERARERKRERWPAFRVLPGERRPNAVLVRGLPGLDPSVEVTLAIEHAEAFSDGPAYTIDALLSGGRLGTASVSASYDPARRLVEGSARLDGVTWDDDLVALLDEEARAGLPPAHLAGRGRANVAAKVRLGPAELLDLSCRIELDDLHGTFASLRADAPEGPPFQLESGSARIEVNESRVVLERFSGVYVSPEGRRGRLSASAHAALGRPHADLHFALSGRDVHATTEDLRRLLDRETSETIVEQYRPGGLFDFDVEVDRRPGLPEKVHARFDIRDGTFTYAGRLDELTGRRFGFRYPLEGCTGTILLESNVPSPAGRLRVVELRSIRGHHPVREPRPGGPERAEVVARGKIVAYLDPRLDQPEDVDAVIEVRNLPIDDDLAAAFASTPGGLPYREFDLSGVAPRVMIEIERHGREEPDPRANYEVFLEGCTLAHESFPLPIVDVSGRITSREPPPGPDGGTVRVLTVEGVRGRAREGGEFTASGVIEQGGEERVTLHIRGEDVVLGEEAERALERKGDEAPGALRLWRKTRPYGAVDVDIRFNGQGEPAIDVDLQGKTHLRGYEDYAYSLTDLTGHLIVRAGEVSAREVRGQVAGAPVRIEGRFLGDGAFSLDATARGLELDEPLLALVDGLAPEAARAVRTLEPAAGSRFDLTVRAAGDGVSAPRVVAGAAALDLSLRPFGIPARLSGRRIETDGETLSARDLWLEAGGALIHLREGSVALGPGAGGRLLLAATGVRVDGFLDRIAGEGLEDVLGGALQMDLSEFEVTLNRADGKVILAGAVDLYRLESFEGEEGTLEPTGAYELAPLTVLPPTRPGGAPRFAGLLRFRGVKARLPLGLTDLSGTLLVGEGSLDGGVSVVGAVRDGAAVLLGRRLEDVSLNLELRPDFLRLGEVEGRFYGGALRGLVESHLAEPNAFRAWVRLEEMELGEFLRPDMPHTEYEGKVDASFEIQSPSGDARHLSGRGAITVRDGELVEIPVLRTIFGVLGRVTPIRATPRFEDAEAEFRIRGERILLDRVHLSTAMNDIHAYGEMSIYGDLDLAVEPQVTRLIDLPRLFNLPVLSLLRNLWHRTAYEFRLEGTLGSPALRVRALPFLQDRRRAFAQSPHAGHAERMRPSVLP